MFRNGRKSSCGRGRTPPDETLDRPKDIRILTPAGIATTITDPQVDPRISRGEGDRAIQKPYLCSKSTGAVTSCTRKYFASAGYFRATASYIAYATLRYETCPAGVVRSSEM